MVEERGAPYAILSRQGEPGSLPLPGGKLRINLIKREFRTRVGGGRGKAAFENGARQLVLDQQEQEELKSRP